MEAAEGPTEEWFADLDRRIEHEAEDGIDLELQNWARFRARQTEAVAERLAAEGPTHEWFAALDRRIDDMERVGTVPVYAEDVTPGRRPYSVRLIAPPRPPSPRATNGIDAVTTALDRAVSKVERSDAPWLRLFSRARPVLVGLVVAFAVGAAVCAGAQLYLVALALVLGATGADLLEGAVGRVSGTESSEGRWFAAVASHVADVAVVVGIAVAQIHTGHGTVGAVVFIAVICGLLGSLARTLAREVGLVLWNSAIAERAVRLAATAGCLGLSLIGDARAVAPWFTAVLFGGFGVREMVRVGLRVHAKRDGGPCLLRGPRGVATYLPAEAMAVAVSPSALPNRSEGDDGPACAVPS